MRAIARQKLGYYPLPPNEAARIRRFLSFPQSGETTVLDPCAGTGAALSEITRDADANRYAIELDAFRADAARAAASNVLQGNCFDVHCAVDSFSLLFLNPPYDFEVGESRNQRMERLFLRHTYRWLKPGGVLIFVVPGDRLHPCSDVLSVHFRDKAIYRLTDPDSVKYQQVVLFGVRRSKREREQLKDGEVERAKAKLYSLGRDYASLPVLPDLPDRAFPVPPATPTQMTYRGVPLDVVEDLLPASAAYRQAGRVLFAPETHATGRPLTPLHGGHIDTIRHVADFCCKSHRIRLLSSWLHFIVEMFPAICCTERARSDVSVVAGERQQHHFVSSGGPLLPVAACPANANLFFERSVAFAEIDFNARSGSQVPGSA